MAETHAALMDSIYRYQRYIYNLTRKYYLFGRDRMIRALQPAPDATVLEIGCGTARNLIRIARRYPGVRLYGLDASHEMLKTAREAVRRAGLEDRIVLAHGYAEQLNADTFGVASFDVAFFSYSLSMIPDWRGAVAAAGAMLSPEGRLWAVDFADLTGLGRIARWALMGWLHLFHVAPREELLATFEAAHVGSLRFLPGRYAFVLTIEKAEFAGFARILLH